MRGTSFCLLRSIQIAVNMVNNSKLYSLKMLRQYILAHTINNYLKLFI